jgi:hypothetical protein
MEAADTLDVDGRVVCLGGVEADVPAVALDSRFLASATVPPTVVFGAAVRLAGPVAVCDASRVAAVDLAVVVPAARAVLVDAEVAGFGELAAAVVVGLRKVDVDEVVVAPMGFLSPAFAGDEAVVPVAADVRRAAPVIAEDEGVTFFLSSSDTDG